MGGSTGRGESAPRLRVARLIWGGCLGALVGYYLILVFLVPQDLAGLNPELAGQLGRILLPVAGAATIFAWIVYRRLTESANASLPTDRHSIEPRTDQAALVVYVTCWALGDGIAVLGLVAGVLGGTMTTPTLLFAWALLLLFLTRPQAMHFPQPRAL